MIPKRVIRDYLEQAYDKDDHRWLKELSEKQVNRMLRDLDPRPKFVTDLWLHQKVCFLLGVAFPQFAFWLDMAGGKTVLALELMNYWRMTGRFRNGIAFSLDVERLYNWEKDIKDHGFEFDYLLMDTGSTKQNWQLIQENDAELILCPYPSMTGMLSDRVPRLNRKGKVIGEELVAQPKLADMMAKFVNTGIWDESTKAGGSSETNACSVLLKRRLDIRYGLAGVPFGRDPILLRRQMSIIDNGATFGPSEEIFRAAFFSRSRNPFGGAHSWNYKFKKKLRPDFRRLLQHRSITYATHEFTDTPEVVRREVFAKLSKPAYSYYADAKERLKKAKKNQQRENMFVRMRQISSGFLGFKDDETGERAEIEFEVCPKFDRLMELVEAVPKKRKFLIAYEFTYSGRKIYEELQRRGIECGWLWSGTGKKLSREIQERYDEDPGFRGIVGNWRKVAFGLNAQAGNYEFVYESPVPVIERKQLDRRMDRPGQERTVFLTDLVTLGTADEKILEFHRDGGDLFKACMR